MWVMCAFANISHHHIFSISYSKRHIKKPNKYLAHSFASHFCFASIQSTWNFFGFFPFRSFSLSAEQAKTHQTRQPCHTIFLFFLFGLRRHFTCHREKPYCLFLCSFYFNKHCDRITASRQFTSRKGFKRSKASYGFSISHFPGDDSHLENIGVTL